MTFQFSLQKIKRAIAGFRARLMKEKATKTMSAPHSIQEMMQRIAATRPVEIGCDECFEQLDHFVEFDIAGKNVAEALPLVSEHLERCKDCREEFELLRAMLKAQTLSS